MRVLLAMPRYKPEVCIASAQAFYHASSPDAAHEVRAISPSSSLATSCFNQCWALARNEWEAGRIDAFAMIHSDVAPPIHWLDYLIEEMERVGVDMISHVVPIKDAKGITSTAVDDTGDSFRVRRLTLAEVHKLPKTFTEADTGAPLCLNTGLWVVKLGPWMQHVHFRVQDQIYRNPGQAGLWCVKTMPEDWDFSQQVRSHGVKLAATQGLTVDHIGEWKWSSADQLGWETDLYNSPEAIKTATEGWQFPDDVDGWLTEEEGRFLATSAIKKRVLEIGSYCGRSTICMAQTASLVHVVDTFDGQGTPRPRDTHKLFWQNIARYGCAGKIIEHVGKAEEQVPNLNKNFDLVFIDGAHDYQSVKTDARLAMSVLQGDGLLAFHDYERHTNPEVTRAINDLLTEGCSLVEVKDTVALVRPGAR